MPAAGLEGEVAQVFLLLAVGLDAIQDVGEEGVGGEHARAEQEVAGSG